MLMKMTRLLPVFVAVLALASCGTREVNVLPTATATFTPGTFTVSHGEAGTPGWRGGPLVLAVTFGENQITGIDVVEHGETLHGSGWFFRAYPAVPDQILARQSTQDIDAFTGATVTRNSFVAAVNEAIVLAGADPADLVPQISERPLAGDRFIPGFYVVTVPAATMDIDGMPLTANTAADRTMLFSNDTDMTLRVSVGRNDFHVHVGGAFGLGQGAGGHGESIIFNPAGIGGGTWGSWWFRQVVAHQVNDRQSTRDIDVFTGATRSASAIVWGVEQALAAAGGTPGALVPRTVPPVHVRRNPGAPDAPFFVPGHYTVSAPGFGGDVTLRVTLDRDTIRNIVVVEQNETEPFWNMAWPALRDTIYTTQNLDAVDVVTGATLTSTAVLAAVREALRLADPRDRR